MKFSLLPFLCRFHAANGNLGASDFVPPAIQPARNRLFVNGRLCAEFSELFLPALRVALFRFRPAQENAPAFLVVLALGQIPIGVRGLYLRLPVALSDFDRLLSIFGITRPIFVAHTFQSAGSSAELMGGSTRACSCCAVITSATEPIMRLAATSVRTVKVSPSKSVPNKTAKIGFKYD